MNKNPSRLSNRSESLTIITIFKTIATIHAQVKITFLCLLSPFKSAIHFGSAASPWNQRVQGKQALADLMILYSDTSLLKTNLKAMCLQSCLNPPFSPIEIQAFLIAVSPWRTLEPLESQSQKYQGILLFKTLEPRIPKNSQSKRKYERVEVFVTQNSEKVWKCKESMNERNYVLGKTWNKQLSISRCSFVSTRWPNAPHELLGVSAAIFHDGLDPFPQQIDLERQLRKESTWLDHTTHWNFNKFTLEEKCDKVSHSIPTHPS